MSTVLQGGALAAVRVLEEALAVESAERSPLLAPQHGPQRAFLDASEDVVIYGGAAGGGKAVSLDTPIPTPNGWTTMGELRAGDFVLGDDGVPVAVSEAHPVFIPAEAYRLQFDDGTEVSACADHLWNTFTAADLAAMSRRTEEFRKKRRDNRPRRATGKKSAKFSASLSARNSLRAINAEHAGLPTGAIRPTREIAGSLTVGAKRRANHAIPVCAPVELPSADLPVSPYLLGVWLGDGTTTAGVITTADKEIVDALTDDGFLVVKQPSNRYGYCVRGLATQLRALGVLGDKHVPGAYMRSSKAQRLSLLQGLMDTDGTACKSGSVSFTSTNRRLAEAVAELACSLGSKAVVTEGRARLCGKDCGPRYGVKWTASYPVFRIARKVARQKMTGLRRTTRFRYVVSCEKIAPVPMRCITVANAAGMYLCSRSFIPTHNTYGLLLKAMRYIHEPSYTAVIFRRTTAQVRKVGGLWDLAMQVLPLAGGTPRKGDLSFTFPGGATIAFSHLEEEKSKLDWQGAELAFIGFDEVTHFTESQFWYLFSRARSKSPSIRPVICATCNPDPDSFVADLLLGRWVDEATGDPIESESGRRYHFGRDGERMIFAKSPQDLIGVREPRSITFIRSTLDDNRILVARDQLYRANLEALPYVERMRLLHGNWKVRPTAGMVFSRGWFELIQDAPAGGRDVRYWDKAGTEGAGCMTAGVRMRRVGDTYYVIDVVRGQHGAQNRERLIRQVTELDGPDVVSWIEREPGSGGKESAENTIRSLAGFSVYADRVTGPKVARWSPFAAQAEAGNVKVLNRSWTQAFLEALHNADGEHPKNVDEVDAASGAFAKLALVREYAQVTRRPWG